LASANQIAKTLGVSHVAILKAVKAGSIKPASNGQLTLDLVRNSEWYRNRQGKASPKKSEPVEPVDEFANIDKIDLEKRLIAERTEALRLDNEERKKNLLPADEVRGAMEAIISTTRSHLLLLPAKLAHKVSSLTDPAECQAVIDAEIKAALKALSETTFNE
jgi:hypothetical protein